jgi:hypothetical protein
MQEDNCSTVYNEEEHIRILCTRIPGMSRVNGLQESGRQMRGSAPPIGLLSASQAPLFGVRALSGKSGLSR